MMAWKGLPPPPLKVEAALQDREAEGRGFAGAGAGLAEDVFAGEGGRDECLLDFGGGFEVNIGEGVKEGGLEAQGGEGFGELDFEVTRVVFGDGRCCDLVGFLSGGGPGIVGFIFVDAGGG